jgi:hypothetical protein
MHADIVVIVELSRDLIAYGANRCKSDVCSKCLVTCFLRSFVSKNGYDLSFATYNCTSSFCLTVKNGGDERYLARHPEQRV